MVVILIEVSYHINWNLQIKAVNRIISAEGNYSAIYIARDQKIADEKIADLDVRLLKLSSGHGVLAVSYTHLTLPTSDLV